MANFKCDKCGATKEGRCKPQKCPQCGEKGCMVKEEDAGGGGKCGCGCQSSQ
ncbi:MAG: hypothetical protein U5J62_01450 [Desulfurivibrio sp.]|nr:hypothetical protein [Desulfurivibrio sp.]